METYSPFNWKLAFGIALFSFSNYITQPLYSAFVPLLLTQRLSTAAQVGAILSACNFLAMLIHPAVGALSDRTRCRFGRRRPYILSGALSCGLFFLLIPWLEGMWSLLAVLVAYSLTVAYWRAPVSAIQVDCVPPEHIVRSNAVSSCMLALASVMAYLFSNRLVSGGADLRLVFAVGGGAAVAAALWGCSIVREEDSRQMALTERQREPGGLAAALREQDLPALAAILLAVALAYMANSAFEYFFTLFSTEWMGLEAGRAPLYLAVYMGAYFLASLTCSILRSRRTPWRMVALFLGASACVQVLFFALCGSGPSMALAGAWLLCVVYGGCWGMVNIYIYPLWLSFRREGRAGNLMGLYFVCTGLASTLAPVTYGLVRDGTGTYRSLFLFCGGVFFLACALLAWAGRRQERQSPDAGRRQEV